MDLSFPETSFCVFKDKEIKEKDRDKGNLVLTPRNKSKEDYNETELGKEESIKAVPSL